MLDLSTALGPHDAAHAAPQSRAPPAELAVVQRTLGHSSIATTGMYLTPSDDDLRRAIERATL